MTVWAEPRDIASLSDCHFYHTMDLPGHGTVAGDWDLRGREADYLGHAAVRGKRVLEVGTASGHLCFTMERMGAEVVAYDLSDAHAWDIVPYDGYDYAEYVATRQRVMRYVNNAFWIAHRAYGSRARVVYGTVYEMPDDIGQFDVCTFGAILLHLRDPFLALQRALAHTRETAVVTDVAPHPAASHLRAGARVMEFLPSAGTCRPFETWWTLSPEVVAEFLHVLGFVQTTISFHRQRHLGEDVQLYTVVGSRQGVAVPPGARGTDQRSLEEAALGRITAPRIAGHLLRRGVRAVLERLPGRN